MKTASVFPSSRSLVRALVEGIDAADCDVILELGCGTGVVTFELLRRMRMDARLVAVEMNENFVTHLRTHANDDRLTVVHGSAEEIGEQLASLGIPHVDAIVSCVGLATMPPIIRNSILDQASACLAPGGVMTQLEMCGWPFWSGESGLTLRRYRGLEFLKSYFRTVDPRTVLMNLPPAVVYTCQHLL